jgi:lysophospholipase L1-like esterase
MAHTFIALATVAILFPGQVQAITLTQNLSWTVDRPGTDSKYRMVAYGDSINAGFYGSFNRVAKRAGPTVSGEYLAASWDADIEIVRRTESGARAEAIYYDRIVNEDSYMQTPDTRVVTFEMCGNDYLQARAAFAAQIFNCDFRPLENAVKDCRTYMTLAMDHIKENAHANTKAMIVSTIYYPGYDADDVLSHCTDSETRERANRQDVFLPLLARTNWMICDLAAQKGFLCADTFAEFMGADYDSNGDGQIDSEALRIIPGESQEAYLHRITVTLRSTLRDGDTHFTDPSTSYDYILSDMMHPTHYGSTTGIGWFFGGSGSGSGEPDFSDAEIQDGKNPEWNKWGHEKYGWTLSLHNPASP